MGHNPTSGVLSLERRRHIYALCSKYDIIIIEDDPYWHLQFPSAAAAEAKSRGLSMPSVPATYKPRKSSGYDFLDSLVPSYMSLDTDGRVIRLDTFSKTMAPGCRLGWVTAQPAFIERLTRWALRTSLFHPRSLTQSAESPRPAPSSLLDLSKLQLLKLLLARTLTASAYSALFQSMEDSHSRAGVSLAGSAGWLVFEVASSVAC